MTILCTTFVPDGIVMAADSRLTNEISNANEQGNSEKIKYTLTDGVQKIVLLKNKRIGISFCGNAFLDGKSVVDYIRLFEIKELKPKDSVITVARKLFNYSKKFLAKTTFFVCGYIGNEPYVYILNETLVRGNENSEHQLLYGTKLGGQSSNINKLISNDEKLIQKLVSMPLKEAITFSEFIVDTTIKYEHFQNGLQTCGGDIDILVLTKDDAFWYQHKIYNPKK